MAGSTAVVVSQDDTMSEIIIDMSTLEEDESTTFLVRATAYGGLASSS